MITISTILTCYNEGILINNALNSLLNQSDKDFEIIIVNDCSKDEETNRICKGIGENNSIKIIWNETNIGLSGSRNIAVEKMKNDVAVFLDADDILTENAIANIKNTFNVAENIDFVFGNYLKKEKALETTIDCSIIADENGYLSPLALTTNWILLGTSPFKKKLWEKNIGYSLEFSNTCQDVDFWQKAILNGARGKYINKTIYVWNYFSSNMNSSLNHRKAIDICNYKNVEFYFQFSNDLNKAFNILNWNKDFKQIKQRAATLKKNSFLKIATIIPLFLIPIYFKTYNFLFHKHRIV